MKRNHKIIVFLISLLFIIVTAELFLREFYPVSHMVKVTYKGDKLMGGCSFRLSNDPVLLYEWKDLPQTFTTKKPENTFRIIVLGDSIVFRQQWPLNDYFPRRLEKLLNTGSRKTQYEVLNAGVPGYNTKQEERYLETRLLPFSPDMIIVGYCAANDRVIKRRVVKYKDGLYCSDILESYPYLLGPPPRLVKYLMKHSMLYRFINTTLIRIAGKIDKNLLNGRIEYFDYSFETEDAFKAIRDIALKEKFALVFIIFPILRDGEQDECDWVINKCQQYSIPYIDLRDIFKKTGYERIRISDDDYGHPNQRGHQLAAEEIFRYLDNASIRRQ
jgi:lysophospholipase L1-like esterase